MSVLVVGAIHHDVIVETPSIPRQDETLPGTDVRYAFGGKGGNQALAAARLGSQAAGIPVIMAACIGEDAPGQNALVTLQSAGVDIGQMQRVTEPTGMSVALSLPDGGYGAVIVSASNLQLDASQIALPADLQWLILQNELPASINLATASRAKQAGAKVLLNAAPARAITKEFLALIDVLVVNRIEAADLLGSSDGTFDGEASAQTLADRYGCNVVLTRGSEGVWISDDTPIPTHLAAHTVDVISTHGAGDAFIGALTVQLHQGAALSEAARFANAAAALHVSTPVDQRADITLDAIKSMAQTSSL